MQEREVFRRSWVRKNFGEGAVREAEDEGGMVRAQGRVRSQGTRF